MSAVLSLFFLSGLFVVALAFAFHYWQQGNYSTALPWAFGAYIFLGLGIAFALQYYVIAPIETAKTLAAPQSDVRERPHVFFKMTKLLKPLAIGEQPIVEFVLANSGQMEANGAIRDITYFFDVDPPKHSFEYQTSEPVSFSLAPTAEWNGQIRLSFVLTKEKIDAITEGRARLFFFARGEYKDSLGRSYPLPFCRTYDKDMPGNLIMCPDQMTIKQKKQEGERPN